MKIFLTGGTGFIGSHFINQALVAGHDIIAVRRPGSKPRIPLVKEPIWLDGSLEEDWTTDMIGCDVFVHLAAHSANTPYDTLTNCNYWNVYVSTKLAEQAFKSNIRHFLIAGSCFEYGNSASRYERIPVNAPLEPTSSYPTSKAAASISFIGFAAENNVKLKILRLFQVFGEGEQETRLWPAMKAAALQGHDFKMSAGEQVRDFINVTDVANAFISELNFDGCIPGVAFIKNIGTGSPSTLKEFCESWWRKWEANGKLIFGAVPYRKNEIMRLVPEI